MHRNTKNWGSLTNPKRPAGNKLGIFPDNLPIIKTIESASAVEITIGSNERICGKQTKPDMQLTSSEHKILCIICCWAVNSQAMLNLKAGRNATKQLLCDDRRFLDVRKGLTGRTNCWTISCTFDLRSNNNVTQMFMPINVTRFCRLSIKKLRMGLKTWNWI